MKKQLVVAVIPNYNMAESLKELLKQVVYQGYDAIYVLDDASTDDSIKQARSFGSKVKVIEGTVNLGAAGNRNRIIDQVSDDATIHFIDADMRLLPPAVPQLAQKLFIDSDIGFIGGTILTTKHNQLIWNYGPRLTLRNDLSALLHQVCFELGRVLPGLEQWLRKHSNSLQAWPNPRAPLKERRVYWAAEANMLIKAGTFKALEGYDPALRDHDILDLSIRAEALGLNNYFNPSFSAVHTAVNVRSGNRRLSMFKAEKYIARKHGLKTWLRKAPHVEP